MTAYRKNSTKALLASIIITLYIQVQAQELRCNDTSDNNHNDNNIIDNNGVTFQTYAILDLKGMPRLLNQNNDILTLQNAFQNAYQQAFSCDDALNSRSYRILDSVTILPDAIQSYTNNNNNNNSMNDVMITSDEPQTFSYLLQISGRSCSSCQQTHTGTPNDVTTHQDLDLFHPDPNPIVLPPTTTTPTIPSSCSCVLPTQQDFLTLYKQAFDTLIQQPPLLTDVTDILNVTQLDFQDACDPTNVQPFQSQVLLTLSVPVSGQYTPQDMAILEALFVESYNQANILNKDVCDENLRNITSVVISSIGSDVVSVPVKESVASVGMSMLVTVSGTCQGCNSLFDKQQDQEEEEDVLDGTSNPQGNDSSSSIIFQRRTRTRQRHLQQQQDNDDMDGTDGRKEDVGCLCWSDAVRRASTEEEFLNELNTAIDATPSLQDTSVLALKEVE